MRWRCITGLAAAILIASGSPSDAQGLPDTIRAAGITVAQWSAVQVEVRRTAAALGVSERALGAIAERLGVEAAGGDGLSSILQEIELKAQQLRTLQDRLLMLEQQGEPLTANFLRGARESIDRGDLDHAETLLREARVAARQAREQAQYREAEIIAAEASIQNLRHDFRGAAASYAEAAELIPATDTAVRWRYRYGQAFQIMTLGERSVDNAVLLEAIGLFREQVIPLAPLSDRVDDWAQSMAQLGWATRTLGVRAGGGALEQAVQIYREALVALPAGAGGEGRASLHSGLGATLHEVGVRGDSGVLREAAAQVHAALDILTPDANYARWIGAMSNLGGIYRALGSRGDPDAIDRAIATYRAALVHASRETAPYEWSTLQSNLGVALWERGTRASSLEAVQVLREAAEVIDRNTNPDRWATIQTNLLAAMNRADPENLEIQRQAVETGEAILEIYTKDGFPRGWALVQLNVAVSLVELARHDAAMLDDAIARLRAVVETFDAIGDGPGAAAARLNLANALEHRSRSGPAEARNEALTLARSLTTQDHRDLDALNWARAQASLATWLTTSPQADDVREAADRLRAALTVVSQRLDAAEWARVNHLLGDALVTLGQREEAIRHYDAALQVRTPETYVEAWVSTMSARTNAAYDLARRNGDTAMHLAVIEAYREIARVRTREVAPEEWATTQYNLGNALHTLDNAAFPESEQQAVDAYRASLQVRTRETSPTGWANALDGLGNALMELESGDRAAHVQEALAAYRDALSAYSRERDANDWAIAQNNYGNALLSVGDRASLETAAEAFRGALQVFRPETAPGHFATVQENLGRTLDKLVLEHGNDEAGAAAAAWRTAAALTPADTQRRAWQVRQYNLAMALTRLYANNKDEAVLAEAIAAHRRLIATLEGPATPGWGGVHGDLAVVLHESGDRGNRGDYAAAATAAREYVNSVDRGADALAWAGAQNTFCWSQAHAAQYAMPEEAGAAAAAAIEACETARGAFTLQDDAGLWGHLSDTSGFAYEVRGDITGARADYERAAALYREALTILTAEAYAEAHAIASQALTRVEAKLARG
ncbi:MAG: hypothetical protein AB7H66_00060 [Hyphomonadaceae bacterium]